MAFLVILVAVAVAGIGAIWVKQRRERAHLQSSEAFLRSLQMISPEVQPEPIRRSYAAARKRARRPQMDPQRRAEVRRRVEARRRAEAHRRRAEAHRRAGGRARARRAG